MKKLIQSSYIMISILLCSVITGCNELSRPKAKKIVLERIHSNNDAKNLYLSYTRNNFGTGIQVSGKQLEQAKLLEQAGYVTITYSGNRYYAIMNPLPKIEPYYFYNKYSFYTECIIVATFNDITITGISGSDNYKEVYYTSFYSLNEVGQLLSYEDLSFSGTMSLTKYDDGWR